MEISIVNMLPEDWEDVKSIYQEGIDTGNSTFETKVPEWEEWNGNHLKDCRLVIRVDDRIIGWAALSPVSNRPIFNGVAEISIYLTKSMHNKGLGKRLLVETIDRSENLGFYTLVGYIFPENTRSIQLFQKCGFRKVHDIE